VSQIALVHQHASTVRVLAVYERQVTVSCTAATNAY
jgi:hypothetical protein